MITAPVFIRNIRINANLATLEELSHRLQYCTNYNADEVKNPIWLLLTFKTPDGVGQGVQA